MLYLKRALGGRELGIDYSIVVQTWAYREAFCVGILSDDFSELAGYLLGVER